MERSGLYVTQSLTPEPFDWTLQLAYVVNGGEQCTTKVSARTKIFVLLFLRTRRMHWVLTYWRSWEYELGKADDLITFYALITVLPEDVTWQGWDHARFRQSDTLFCPNTAPDR